MRGKKVSKKESPISNSRNVSLDFLLAFLFAHTGLKLHRHYFNVDTFFMETVKKAKLDVTGWCLSDSDYIMRHMVPLQIRAKGSTTSALRNKPRKGFKWLPVNRRRHNC